MKEIIDLSWRPLALMFVVLVCFSVVSAPAVTMAQDAPAVDAPAAEDAATVDAAEAPVVDASEEDAPAEAAALTPVTPEFMINNLWIMLAGMLVFIMHLGFATLESGLTRSKNTVNILFKNTMIVCIGIITYGVCGFNLMYPGYETAPDDWDRRHAGRVRIHLRQWRLFWFC